MKTRLLLVSFLIGLIANAQNSADQGMTSSQVVSKFLEVTNASNLENINSITTRYEGQTALGEITIEKTTTKDKIVEKYLLAGTVIFHVVATTEKCYQVNGEQEVPLPEMLCNDFKPFVGLLPESNLVNNTTTELTSIDVDGKSMHAVKITGEMTTYLYIFDPETGLKMQERQVTKSGDKESESITNYKDYKEYDAIQFPTIQILGNFLQSGSDAELKLIEVVIDKN